MGLQSAVPPAYDWGDVPFVLPDGSESVLIRVRSRKRWQREVAELIGVCDESERRRCLRRNPKAVMFESPIARAFVEDRLQLDDPLVGYMVRDATSGHLQGFVVSTTFTTWVKADCFRWVRPAAGSSSGRKKGVCADRSLVEDLNQCKREGDPMKQGCVWSGVAELSLVGGLGCGSLLVSQVLEHMRDGRIIAADGSRYGFVVVQATKCAVSFYERVGFKHIGACARHFTTIVGEGMDACVDQNAVTTRFVPFRHFEYTVGDIEPSMMMALRLSTWENTLDTKGKWVEEYDVTETKIVVPRVTTRTRRHASEHAVEPATVPPCNSAAGSKKATSRTTTPLLSGCRWEAADAGSTGDVNRSAAMMSAPRTKWFRLHIAAVCDENASELSSRTVPKGSPSGGSRQVKLSKDLRSPTRRHSGRRSTLGSTTSSTASSSPRHSTPIHDGSDSKSPTPPTAGARAGSSPQFSQRSLTEDLFDDDGILSVPLVATRRATGRTLAERDRGVTVSSGVESLGSGKGRWASLNGGGGSRDKGARKSMIQGAWGEGGASSGTLMGYGFTALSGNTTSCRVRRKVMDQSGSSKRCAKARNGGPVGASVAGKRSRGGSNGVHTSALSKHDADLVELGKNMLCGGRELGAAESGLGRMKRRRVTAVPARGGETAAHGIPLTAQPPQGQPPPSVSRASTSCAQGEAPTRSAKCSMRRTTRAQRIGIPSRGASRVAAAEEFRRIRDRWSTIPVQKVR